MNACLSLMSVKETKKKKKAVKNNLTKKCLFQTTNSCPSDQPTPSHKTTSPKIIIIIITIIKKKRNREIRWHTGVTSMQGLRDVIQPYPVCSLLNNLKEQYCGFTRTVLWVHKINGEYS